MSNEAASVMRTVAAAYHMNSEEMGRLLDAKVPLLIASLPFIAGCPEAERIAASHLSTYLLSIKTDLFNARKEDNTDLMARLERISRFPGGDERVVKKGMSILALCMLSNYKNDIEKDGTTGKYNPLGSKAFDYEVEKNALLGIIAGINSPEIDAIMTAEDGLRGWWDL